MSNSSESFSPKFCVSGSTTEDNEDLLSAIQVLGGELLEGAILRTECTHLLVGGLAKREKVLAALARAIPILDLRRYLEKCVEEEKWITDEEMLKPFDLGGIRAKINKVFQILRQFLSLRNIQLSVLGQKF